MEDFVNLFKGYFSEIVSILFSLFSALVSFLVSVLIYRRRLYEVKKTNLELSEENILLEKKLADHLYFKCDCGKIHRLNDINFDDDRTLEVERIFIDEKTKENE